MGTNHVVLVWRLHQKVIVSDSGRPGEAWKQLLETAPEAGLRVRLNGAYQDPEIQWVPEAPP